MSVHNINSASNHSIGDGNISGILGSCNTDMGVTSANSLSMDNSSLGLPFHTMTYPYQYQYDYQYPFRIRQILNGWIVGTCKGEFCFKESSEVGKFIAKELAALQPK